MSSTRSPKRPSADRPPGDDRPTKKTRLSKRSPEPNPFHWPPEWWDELSKVWLTRRALREFDRRNKLKPSPSPAPHHPAGSTPSLAQFARCGGPDLRHLRAYQEPVKHQNPGKGREAMDSTNSASTSASSRRTKSTRATSAIARTRKSSAYDMDFEQRLEDNQVYLHNENSEPENLDEIRSEINKDAPTVSPILIPESDFPDFRRKNKSAVFENDVMASIIPILCGTTEILSKQDVLFTQSEPVASDKVTKLKPDFFDGASLRDLHQDIRQDQTLRSKIVPTKHPQVPVAPNLFLENYKADEPVYDEKAYSFSMTYCNGLLTLYAHHITSPPAVGSQPEYHMTGLGTWQMAFDAMTFRRGLAAFRNARDLAKRHRDRFVQMANARASRPPVPSFPSSVAGPAEPGLDSGARRDGADADLSSSTTTGGKRARQSLSPPTYSSKEVRSSKSQTHPGKAEPATPATSLEGSGSAC
ncbi:hypothetical protein CDD83_9249 [Cordyceps sp. RAO-2017]|nr:hypothetical protein CDD83_9249 [Cordyceps sp. RAO-2017]